MAQIPDAQVKLEVGEIKPQKWEYITHSLRDYTIVRIEDILNSHGSDGWELVMVDSIGLAYLKRPIWE